ncbi:MAG: hypothetical protein ACLVL7_10945 [Anaerotruncus massiliensis (ex Togo et al. 2019)]
MKAGDLLFTLDADDLARQVLEKQLELQRAQLQLQEAQQKAALGRRRTNCPLCARRRTTTWRWSAAASSCSRRGGPPPGAAALRDYKTTTTWMRTRTTRTSI